MKPLVHVPSRRHHHHHHQAGGRPQAVPQGGAPRVEMRPHVPVQLPDGSMGLVPYQGPLGQQSGGGGRLLGALALVGGAILAGRWAYREYMPRRHRTAERERLQESRSNESRLGASERHLHGRRRSRRSRARLVSEFSRFLDAQDKAE